MLSRSKTGARAASGLWRRAAILAALVSFTLASVLAMSAAGIASTVSSANFTGGSGTVSVGSVLYAKQGGALTLTVNTSSDTKCVDVTGAFTGHQTSSSAKSSWTFNFTASTGDGVKTVTATASPNFNANNCTGQSQSPRSASFILDNTGPVVTAALSPTPNGAGWNDSNVSVTWSAADAGSGVASGPTPATDSQTSNTAGVTKTSTATDRLGNSGSGSVTIKLDKTAPTITGNRSPAANANGWNNSDVTVGFSCSDSLAGIKSCSGPTTLTDSAANQSVTATAVDNADNSASASVSGINIDKVAPTLTGAPTTSPNDAGWYNGNVTIHWSASDALSGLAGSSPTDSTISSEGTGLTAQASVFDKAGNTTNAPSSPAVKIDKTAPLTTATAPTNWNNTDVTVSLDAADALSGVADTFYELDGGPQQSGASVQISAEGTHSLQFWSVDKAGNTEAAKTVNVKIDKTPPTITDVFDPLPNANGWLQSDVTVTFACADPGSSGIAGSGIASCTGPQTVSTEGKDQAVTGTAIDNAGNATTDPAKVSIDKTAPTIKASVDRPANAAGWYMDDVVVSFECADALSGIDTCPVPKTLGEGADQSTSGTATDAAGNSASDGVSHINVDKSAPTLAGAATTAPNANGWYRDDVTVHWTCSDGLSGVDGGCPADSVISGESDNLSASAVVSDKAGNTTATAVDHIKIDRTPPTTTVSVTDPLDSGWYANAAKVTLTGHDGLSGVDKTYYAVDSGAAQAYSGPFDFALKGVHTISFWSVDDAGNTEDQTAAGHTVTLKIDNVRPTITGARTPAANQNGWNNQPVTVSFSCADQESGVAGCSDPTTVSTEGAGQFVTGNAADNAGNTAETMVTGINIDLTPPDIAGQLPDPNGIDSTGAKWYTGDVAVNWACADGLSGIDGPCPAAGTISGEGRHLGAGPVSVSDKAGNSSFASVTDVNIDRNGPVISGAPTTQPNQDGWYSGLVKVAFGCADPNLADGSPGSGVASCPSDIAITDEGANLSVTSDAAKDYAGNSTAGKTVGGINIDNTPPVSTDTVNCTLVGNYCNAGSPVSMTINASDPTPTGVTGVSGVKEIHYSKDGGATWMTATGSSVNVPITLSASGTAAAYYYAVDKAGNAEDKHADSINYDGTPPAVSHTLAPLANAADWSNANTLVHFNATDDSGGSGVNTGTLTPDQTYSTETADQLITGSADDNAGNHGTDSFHFHLDKTAPTISAAVTPGSPDGNNGWYVHAVLVTFSCADPAAANGAAGSGVATCPDPVTLSQNGANQSVTRSVADKADNTASKTASGINIDMENPTLTIGGVKDGGIYTLGSVPTPTCNATDSFSGVASCKGSLSGGLPNGVGTFTYTATATDKAGNLVTQSVSYKVIYNVPANVAFFLQPINDTAHTASTTLSIFKAGQTVPVKFQLKNAAGQIVQANSAPIWQTPAQGNLTTSAVNEDSFTTTGDSASGFRWDSTAQQYIYNWNTSSTQGGYYWKIGVKLDDGMTYFTDIGLRK
ncbi:MAG TPA: PxKF domain-containing protein [Mycobacterium sp.]|nr:PxKF domain-containing protein [Mycobacterium sp.]